MKGFVTQALAKELETGGTDLVVTVGPAIMMKTVANTTRPFGVKTIVSLNPIMVDGTGMCGGCRVSVGGRTLFACTDGPEFDGHEVDWDILMTRQKTYVPEQKESFETWRQRHAGALCE
jgi:ferredoxin--NADP+ reductase